MSDLRHTVGVVGGEARFRSGQADSDLNVRVGGI